MKKTKFSIDYKRILLEKGEKIGLISAGGIGSLLVVLGVLSFVGSSRPSTHAHELSGVATEKKNQMDHAEPPSDLNVVRQSELPDTQLGDHLAPQLFAFREMPIDARPIEIDKRREPHIYVPDQWLSIVVHLPIRSLDFNEDFSMLRVVEGDVGKDTKLVLDAPPSKGKFGSTPGGKNSRGGGRGGAGGGTGGRGPNLPLGQQDLGAAGKAKGHLVLLPLDKLKGDVIGVRPAEKVLPLRMAMVVGAFPMRKQYQEYIDKLAFHDINGLLKDRQSIPRFESILVQRRTIAADGTPADDWKDIDIRQQMINLLILTRKEVEPDDPKLSPIAMPGLVMPRPLLFNLEKYGKIEYPKIETELPEIQSSLKELARKGSTAPLPSESPFLKDDQIDPFSPNPGGKAKKGKTAAGSGSGSEDKPMTIESIPEHCLVRFLDSDNLEPGKTYEYRMQLKVRNPNFGREDQVMNESLAKDESLYSGEGKGDWTLVPNRVYVPEDFQLFAYEDKLPAGQTATNRDQVTLQIHEWVSDFYPDPTKTTEESKLTIGDWLVVEHEAFHRGELIHRAPPVTYVPIYNALLDDFHLVENPRARGKDYRLRVYFGPERGEAVVVDFEGGVKKQKKLDGIGNDPATLQLPQQVAIVGPDGKLIAHIAEIDNGNLERKARAESFFSKVNILLHLRGPKGSSDNAYAPRGSGSGS